MQTRVNLKVIGLNTVSPNAVSKFEIDALLLMVLNSYEVNHFLVLLNCLWSYFLGLLHPRDQFIDRIPLDQKQTYLNDVVKRVRQKSDCIE